MASLNRNIKTGNFIPGSEEYTRPEEIAIMGKYLKAGIKERDNELSLGSDYEKGISNKAQIKGINSLPGEETLTGINNNSGQINHLDRLKETLKVINKDLELNNDFSEIPKEKKKIELNENNEKIETSGEKLKLDNDKESLEIKENNDLIKDVEKLPKGSKKISLESSKSIIQNNEEINPTDPRLYEKLYFENPKTDKRIIPDSENPNQEFKTLDTLLGGIHYDKYSSETLSRSTTSTKDAILAANKGSSDIIFVRPESLQEKETTLVSEKIKGLSSDNESISTLENRSEKIEKSEEILKLDNTFETVSNNFIIDKLSESRENFIESGLKDISSLSSISEDLKIKTDISLSTDLSKINNSKEIPDLSQDSDKLYDIDKDKRINLSDLSVKITEEERELALSGYVDNLLDGKITKLEDQKDYLPDELKKIILIDYLKENIHDDKKLDLILESDELYTESLEIALEDFIKKLNIQLKDLALENKYITLGKQEGASKYLDSFYKELQEISKSGLNTQLHISDDLKNLLLEDEISEMITPQGDSKRYYDQLKSDFELGLLTADELKKTLDELVNANGSLGKKVAIYLTALLGKYKNLKKYLPKEKIEEYRKIVLSSFKDRDREAFLNDTHKVDSEKVIKDTFDLLTEKMRGRIKRAEFILSKIGLERLLENRKMQQLSLGDDKESGPVRFNKDTWTSIKSGILDNTWNSIKSWVTSALNGSLFSAAYNLTTVKANLPGQDYSYDTTIRNVPNVVGFYDKKTSTTGFNGNPSPTPLETTEESSGTFYTRTLSKLKEYNFKSNYLLSFGVQQTLKDLCNTTIGKISTVEDLYDVIKTSEKTTAHARTAEGVMNGMTLSSNHMWEITIEPYISRFNGYRTWLPFIQEINTYNYHMHGVRTIYDEWIPITSFELQDRRLVNKTLALYAGEISYPIVMEHSNELRITIADDSFKSFKTYFDKVAEVSTYESIINTELDKSAAKRDINFVKKRNFGSLSFNKKDESGSSFSTYGTIKKEKFAAGMYKNLCFNICIYILTPQYSTIKKYNLLCVMKDYTVEYVGEIDSGPADVTISFSIVGETSEWQERERVDLTNTLDNYLNKQTQEVEDFMSAFEGESSEGYVDCSKTRTEPMKIIKTDIEIEDEVIEEDLFPPNTSYPAYNKKNEEYDYYKVENSDSGEETLICYGKNGNLF